jgi:BirA family biotin operon repressor/biotin-[acetyl-CoA-carboxylase] ligase
MISALTPLLPGFASLQWLESTGSSNADLIERARQPHAPALPWLLGADSQLSARGRAGRPWQNASGAALMFSCAFGLDLPAATLPGLSPVMGIAACEALRDLISTQHVSHAPLVAETRLQLKWPNDLQWDQAKLAGILIESVKRPGSHSPVIVVGIGLNLKEACALSDALGRPIADWSQIADIAPAQIVASIALAWSRAIAEYASGGYAAFTTRFDRVDALAGHQVDVTDQGQILQTGKASGTDASGRLLLQTDRGMSAIMVGDVSIRPTSTYSAPTSKSSAESTSDSTADPTAEPNSESSSVPSAESYYASARQS